MNIPRTSILLKIARYGGLNTYNNRTDFCSLFWATIWGVLRAPLIGLTAGLGISILLFAVLGPLLWLITWLMHGVVLLDDFLFVPTFALYFVTLMGVTAFGAEKAIATPSSFVRTTYRSWKDKTCLFVSIS